MSPIAFLTNKSIDIVRIEHRRTHIGILHTIFGLTQAYPDLHRRIMDDAYVLTLMGQYGGPKLWTNAFGNMWRAHEESSDGRRSDQNTPWRFAFLADQQETLVASAMSVLCMAHDACDFVIARYTCPPHTWYLNEDDGQVAFLYDQAIRHEQVIDRHTPRAHTTPPLPIAA